MLNIVESERLKYESMWRDVPDYKGHSPGLENFSRFMEIIKPSWNSTLIDIGCGEGVAGLEFAKQGLQVFWMDITAAGLHPDVPRKFFREMPLWAKWDFKYGLDYGYCCDVMEHIPTEYTMLVLDRIISTCRTTWFQIALQPDTMGEQIGQPLHLTVKPYSWWLERLRTLGHVEDARDCFGRGLYIVRSQ